jgi:hypothetical protein
VDKIIKGSFIRWIVGHSVYAACEENVVGSVPIYNYGIVLLVSNLEPVALVAHCESKSYRDPLIILDTHEDNIEILSRGFKDDE